MDIFYWLVAIAALLGVVLNVRKHVACFYIWSVTNAAWAYLDLIHGLYPQAALQAVYFALSLWGIVSWSRKASQVTTKEADDGSD